jgi:hypothetical protein
MKFAIPLLFLFCTNAFAQNMTLVQKSGACSGYHMFWYSLSLAGNSNNDASFSEVIYTDLQSKYKGNSEFSDFQLRALKNLNTALDTKNFNLVKSFAGFCNEIGLPIGQNTKR